MPLPSRLVACTLLIVAAAALRPAQAAAEAPPPWAALTVAQQQALAPLREHWPGIDAGRKQKWLQLARRYPQLSPPERERLQARMADWARMSPQERGQARLQFQETRRLPAEERQARWEAYQALSVDERRALAERTRPGERAGQTAGGDESARSGASKRNIVQPVGTPPRKPVSPTVVKSGPGATTLPLTRAPTPPAHHQAGLPKVAATPGFVDPSTLLPQRGPQAAAVESRPAPSVMPAASGAAASPASAPASSP